MRSRDRSGVLSVSLCFLFAVTLSGQGPDTLWTRTYGGADYDEGSSVLETSDRGYIIVGFTRSFGAGSSDIYLVKTDPGGDTVWTRTYGGTDDDRGLSVQETSDGGYILVGVTNSFGAGEYDVYVIQTDPDGDTLWTRTYGGTDDDGGLSVQETSDGGYIVVGATESFGGGDQDIYLLNIDREGNSLWSKTYGGSGDDTGYWVRKTSDDAYIIAGSTYSFGAGNSDVYLIEANSDGDTVWTRTYGGPGWERGNSVEQTADGGYIVGASTGGDVYLIKVDSLGEVLWTRTYGVTHSDGGKSVQQVRDGGYIIVGYTSSPTDRVDSYLIKTDVNGNALWTKTYGGGSYDFMFSVQQTSDGGYIVAGFTSSFGAGRSDVWVIKTGPEIGVEEEETSQKVPLVSQNGGGEKGGDFRSIFLDDFYGFIPT